MMVTGHKMLKMMEHEMVSASDDGKEEREKK